MKNLEKVTKPVVKVEGKVPASGTEKVTQSNLVKEKPLTKKEMDKMAKRIAGNEKKNADRAFNKEFEVELKKERDEKKEVEAEWRRQNPDAGIQKNKSQLRTLEIWEKAKADGVELTMEDAALIKREENIQAKIVIPSQGVHYFKTLETRVGTRGMYIILMAAIWLIKPACPMSSSPRPFQVQVKALIKAQTDNVGGYFTTPFAGLTLLGTKNGLLLTAIDDKVGSEAILAAMAVVKITLDLLIAYVLALCLADQTNAAAICQSAGMKVVKEKAKNVKPDFTVAQGASGEAKLGSLAGKFNGKRCPTTYYWQYGLMVAGVLTWFDLPETVNRCKTIATGMSTSVAVFFRKRTRTANGGLSAWSETKSISLT